MSLPTDDKAARKQYFTKVREDFPEILSFGELSFLKRLSMRYGENPGYPAAFYVEEKASGPNMATMAVLQEGSKGLGYINVGDMDLGQRLAAKLTAIRPDKKIAVLIKHEMPSGVALADDPVEAYEKAWGVDALSNFGSVDVFNFEVDAPLARLLVESPRNIEVVYAPEFTPAGLEVLATRKPLRVVRMGAPLTEPAHDNGLEFKRVAGGLLIQKRFDSRIVSADSVDVVSRRQPSPRGGPGRHPVLECGRLHPIQRHRHRHRRQDPRHRLGPAQPHRRRRGRHPAVPPRLRAAGLRSRFRCLHALPGRRRAGRAKRHHRPHLPAGLGQGPGGHRQGRRARTGHDRDAEAGGNGLRTLLPAPMSRITAAAALLTGLLAATPGVGAPIRQVPEDYRRAVESIRIEGLKTEGAMAILTRLLQRAPHRLPGSPGYRDAAQACLDEMRGLGLRVWTEPAPVTHWVRGRAAEAVVLGPGQADRRTLRAAALGLSEPTPAEGIEAPIVEARDFEHLKAIGEGARGRIIFFNRPVNPSLMETFTAYGEAAAYRTRGASEAAKLGAVAVLVRSATGRLDGAPHTGMVAYDPAAAADSRRRRSHPRCRMALGAAG